MIGRYRGCGPFFHCLLQLLPEIIQCAYRNRSDNIVTSCEAVMLLIDIV